MSAPIRSMTGFARVRKTTEHGEITVTLKSVNHRGLDLHFHNPPEIEPFENAIRSAIKRAVIRGHLDVRVTLFQTGDSGAGLNEALLRQYLAAFDKAAGEHGIAGARPDLNIAFRMPGMFGPGFEQQLSEGSEEAILAALDEALELLNQFRSREGGELAALILGHNAAVARNCEEIAQIRTRAMPFFEQRLAERLKELLRAVALDPLRLVQEAAILADRSDIGEEVARLKIHSKQLDEIVNAGGEVGRKIDFLVQEMNREANTILSKTNTIGEMGMRITDLALAVKADMEKVREQALNLE